MINQNLITKHFPGSCEPYDETCHSHLAQHYGVKVFIFVAFISLRGHQLPTKC